MNFHYCDGYVCAALQAAVELSIREQRCAQMTDRSNRVVYARALEAVCDAWDPQTCIYRGVDDDGDAWSIQLPDLGDER